MIIIEHNIDVIKCADYIIDMGPEGGKGGGQVLFTGTPEELVMSGIGFTAEFLEKEFTAPRSVFP
jgi:excinuclease ABC subunit A